MKKFFGICLAAIGSLLGLGFFGSLTNLPGVLVSTHTNYGVGYLIGYLFGYLASMGLLGFVSYWLVKQGLKLFSGRQKPDPAP